mmetsp:Transcript_38017/g.88889  ORF Transcript_38017/g.88889 Transcript_38017/m.88889 type:complete len:209 (-) Transcript_38017:7-633(-)
MALISASHQLLSIPFLCTVLTARSAWVSLLTAVYTSLYLPSSMAQSLTSQTSWILAFCEDIMRSAVLNSCIPWMLIACRASSQSSWSWPRCSHAMNSSKRMRPSWLVSMISSNLSILLSLQYEESNILNTKVSSSRVIEPSPSISNSLKVALTASSVLWSTCFFLGPPMATRLQPLHEANERRSTQRQAYAPLGLAKLTTSIVISVLT